MSQGMTNSKKVNSEKLLIFQRVRSENSSSSLSEEFVYLREQSFLSVSHEDKRRGQPFLFYINSQIFLGFFTYSTDPSKYKVTAASQCITPEGGKIGTKGTGAVFTSKYKEFVLAPEILHLTLKII